MRKEKIESISVAIFDPKGDLEKESELFQTIEHVGDITFIGEQNEISEDEYGVIANFKKPEIKLKSILETVRTSVARIYNAREAVTQSFNCLIENQITEAQEAIITVKELEYLPLSIHRLIFAMRGVLKLTDNQDTLKSLSQDQLELIRRIPQLINNPYKGMSEEIRTIIQKIEQTKVLTTPRPNLEEVLDIMKLPHSGNN